MISEKNTEWETMMKRRHPVGHVFSPIISSKSAWGSHGITEEALLISHGRLHGHDIDV